jgi:phosphocarrier protein HPr
MVNARIQLINKLGLHARAASKFSSACGRFSCKTQVTRDGKSIDGKSIMALMLLAAPVGTWLEISCEGVDEEKALQEISELIQNRFGEAE